MDVVIREVSETDLEDIRELNMQSWLEAYQEIIPEEKIKEEVDYTKERLKRKKNDERLIFLVAEVDEKVVGTINFCWGEENTHEFINLGENEAQLRAVYLHPNYWKQGIGTKLFQNGLKLLPDRIGTLKVESLKENVVGRSFYDSKGFTVINEREIELFGDKYPNLIQKLEL